MTPDSRPEGGKKLAASEGRASVYSKVPPVTLVAFIAQSRTARCSRSTPANFGFVDRWVRRPPKPIASDPFFSQVQRIAVIMVSIFLMLAWIHLGNSNGVKPLTWIATLATLVGVVAFFALAGSALSPSFALSLFLAYTVLISCGLTAAAEAVTIAVKNPLNATLGASVNAPAIYRFELD